MKRRFSQVTAMAFLSKSFCSGDPMLPSSNQHRRRTSTRLNLPHHNKRAGPIYQRRNPNNKPIDYGGNHPYEIIHKRRKLDTSFHWYDPTFSVDDYIHDDWYDIDDTYNPATDPDWFSPILESEYFGWDNFLPIRIKFDTRYMDENPVDEAKNEFIIYEILPAAIQFWTKSLSVYPVHRLFVDDNSCSLGNPMHRLYGLNDADLMLYISADKFCQTGANVDTIAGADSCDWDQYERPIGGIVDFCFSSFDIGPNAAKSIEETRRILIEVAIHEIGHVIGLRSNDMAFYYDRLTGNPRTPRPIESQDDIECVTGKMSSELGGETYKPAPTTLRFGAHYPGIRYFEVVTPTVKRVAQNHYNCASMEGLRLENQPTSDDCFGEHWEERLAWDSVMSATLTPSGIPEHLSPFTLALMEDSGWYKANWTFARNPSFGHGAGCDFVDKPCIVDDNVPSYGESYFCDTTDKVTVKCDPTHRMMATCNLYDLSQESGQDFPPVPQNYRHFSNPSLGPLRNRESDWCPMFTERLVFCEDPPSILKKYEEESFGEGSRCFNSSKRPVCFKTFCSSALNALLVKLPGQPVKCDYDGQRIDVSLDGESAYFECPRLATICPELVCPSGCGADNGICDWTSNPPKCVPNLDLKFKKKTKRNDTDPTETSSALSFNTAMGTSATLSLALYLLSW